MRRTSVSLVLLALVGAGCSSSEPASSTASLPPPTTSEATTTSGADGSTDGTSRTAASTTTSTSLAPHVYEMVTVDDQPTVEVVDAGVEPRQTIEFDLAVGDATAMDMTFRFSTSQALGDSEAVGSDLTLVMRLTSEVIDETQRGWVVASTVASTEVLSSNPDIVTTLEPLYAFLTGLTTYVEMAPDGGLVAEDNAALSSFLAASGQDLDLSPGSLVPPLPSEPVGVGARWVTTTLIEEDFVAIEQTSAYELVAVGDGVYEIEAVVEQVMLNPEALALGLTDASVSYVGDGTIAITVDRLSLAPLAASSILDQRIEIRGQADGQDVEVITVNVISVEASVVEP